MEKRRLYLFSILYLALYLLPFASHRWLIGATLYL